MGERLTFIPKIARKTNRTTTARRSINPRSNILHPSPPTYRLRERRRSQNNKSGSVEKERDGQCVDGLQAPGHRIPDDGGAEVNTSDDVQLCGCLADFAGE